MTNIKGLAEQGNIEALGQYIIEIDKTIKSVELKYHTGNPVTDVVLNDRARKAEDKGIVCSFAFSFDEGWGIPVYDLSIILCNILDNAIKAVIQYFWRPNHMITMSAANHELDEESVKSYLIEHTI